jgi:hypothetical protein
MEDKSADTFLWDDVLRDDILREILLRVSTDKAALFRCAAACRRWRGLVADRSFLLRCWPQGICHPSSLIGFFDLSDGHMKTTNQSPLIFIPPPTGSVLGAQPRLLTSIVRGTPDEVCGAMPLLARGGLLLVQLLRGDIFKSVHLAVCDPLAGTCSVLPPIKCKVERINCALLTDADFCSSSQGQGQRRTSCLDGSACFKVFTIVTDSIDIDNRKLSLYTFSSTEPRSLEQT